MNEREKREIEREKERRRSPTLTRLGVHCSAVGDNLFQAIADHRIVQGPSRSLGRDGVGSSHRNHGNRVGVVHRQLLRGVLTLATPTYGYDKASGWVGGQRGGGGGGSGGGGRRGRRGGARLLFNHANHLTVNAQLSTVVGGN